LTTQTHAGYSIGDGSVTSDLSEFLRLSGDRLVIVQVQYRLSAFGFLAGEAVKEQGVLNAGLLDQVSSPPFSLSSILA
jgi:carboxylesterase type B